MSGFGAPPPPRTWQDLFNGLIDVGLVGAVTIVPLALGGRTGPGLFLLACCAVWCLVTWLLRDLLAGPRQWRWTGTEWFWLAATGVLMLQLTALPMAWLTLLSPPLAKLLPLWDGSSGQPLIGSRWLTLSLTPSETRGSLATWLSYAALFWVATQRWRTTDDLLVWLKRWSLVAVAMAVFALVQLAFSNEKFFWIFQHHILTTNDATHGSFPCKNHLAQYLALAVGPLLTWAVWGSTAGAKAWPDSAARAGSGTSAVSLLILAGLALVLLAGLLTLSRGGFLALATATVVGLIALQRARLASLRFVCSLLATLVVMGAVFSMVGYERLSKRIDEQGNTERVLIWKTNLALIQDFPFLGTGFGSHRQAHYLHFDAPDHGHEYADAECSYLQVASEGGLASLGLALLAILIVFRWCGRAMGHADDPALRAVGAAVLPSVMACLAQATVDFIWYLPGCVTPLLLLCAAVWRAQALARDAARAASAQAAPTYGPGPLRYVVLGTPALLLAIWSAQTLWPGCAAEPAWRNYLALAHLPHEFEEDSEEYLDARIACLRQVVAINPPQARAQELLAFAYLSKFDMVQERAEMPLPLSQLREAAVASEFATAQALRAWVKQVAGPNLKYVLQALKHGRIAVKTSPLEGPGYIILSDLAFLSDVEGRLKQRLLDQALQVRPYDPLVLYAAGGAALLNGDRERAIELWQRPFARNPRHRAAIARTLTSLLTPAELAAMFHPVLEDYPDIVAAYRELGTEQEAQQALQGLVSAARQRGQTAMGHASESAWLTGRNTCRELDDPAQGIQLLREGLAMHPYCAELRRALGSDLFYAQQYAEAAEHLLWCAARAPDDAEVQNLASQAARMRLQVTPASYEQAPRASQASQAWQVPQASQATPLRR